jgi:hypothetical protein
MHTSENVSPRSILQYKWEDKDGAIRQLLIDVKQESNLIRGEVCLLQNISQNLLSSMLMKQVGLIKMCLYETYSRSIVCIGKHCLTHKYSERYQIRGCFFAALLHLCFTTRHQGCLRKLEGN